MSNIDFHNYTNKEIIEFVFDFYNKNNKQIRQKDFTVSNGLPSQPLIRKRFGNISNLYKLCGIDISNKNLSKYKNLSKQDLIEYLNKYYKTFSKVPTIRDLKKHKYPSEHHYIKHFGSFKNALVEAKLFDLRDDKQNFDRQEISEKECLDALRKYIDMYQKVPTGNDLRECQFTPDISTYVRRFGGINSALKVLGVDPINKYASKTDQELIHDLLRLYNELGRVPTSRDILKSEFCSGINTYRERFGSFYKALERANIKFTKRTSQLEDDEIIDIWYQCYNYYKVVPRLEDLTYNKYNIASSIYLRWGGYYNFLNYIGKIDEINKGSFRVYFTKKKAMCLSYYEYLITEWLEENEIDFIKEFPYSEAIVKDRTYRRFDWKIIHNDFVYYVEMFGIINRDNYQEKTKQKIKDCKNAGLNLIEIYPEDMKTKSLEEIFSFLQQPTLQQ